MRNILFLLVFMVSTLSYGQGAPEWFLEKVKPLGSAVANLGDSIWTTYYHDEDNEISKELPFDFFAVTCSKLAIEDVPFDDVFVIMGFLKLGKEDESDNLMFLVYDDAGHLLYHRSLGLGDLYGYVETGKIICSASQGGFRAAVERVQGVWYGVCYNEEPKKKKKILGIFPKKK